VKEHGIVHRIYHDVDVEEEAAMRGEVVVDSEAALIGEGVPRIRLR